MSTSVTEYSKTDAALSDLAQRYKGIVFDVTTTKGMQEARVARAELRGYRVDLEKVRVEIKSPALERCRLIDTEAKRITTALVELEDPIDETIKNEEKRKEREAMEKAMANQRRIDAIRARIETIRGIPAGCVGKSSEQINAALEKTQRGEVGADFEEFRVEAEDALKSTLAQLAIMVSGARAQEQEAERIKAERAELATLRAEQEQRERESRAKIEAENRAAHEARAVEDARLQADRDRLAAQQRAADDAMRKQEDARVAAEREIQRKANEVLDARQMLTTFKQRFGHLDEFAGVVIAIDACIGKKRKAA